MAQRLIRITESPNFIPTFHLDFHIASLAQAIARASSLRVHPPRLSRPKVQRLRGKSPGNYRETPVIFSISASELEVFSMLAR